MPIGCSTSWLSVALIAWSIGFAAAQFRPGGNILREPGVPHIGTPEDATRGEQRLLEHPDDVGTVKALWGYYFGFVRVKELSAGRPRVIFWTIENHPEIRMFNERTLLINSDDRDDFSKARLLWLEAVKSH